LAVRWNNGTVPQFETFSKLHVSIAKLKCLLV
jgi:hypothetical protein